MTTVRPPVTSVRVRPLTIVPQGDDFLVGDPTSGTYVVLPAIGVRVIELLRSGMPLDEVATAAAELAGTDVDLDDFLGTICDLGFAERVEGEAADPDDQAVPSPAGTAPRRRRWAPLVVGPPAWILAVGAVVGCLLIFAARPALLPSAKDIFFLSTPVRSLLALTPLMYALRAVHELCHWLTARAEGVSARIRVDRRLYLMVFETDLTGLWGLPRRRRFWPLLSGMAFDSVVLAGVLAARVTAAAGWWQPAPLFGRLLAAVTFVQVAGIITQFFVFLRTDVYAVFVAATGCFNLWQVTRLTLRHRLGLARAAHREQLRAAHPRDRAVAGWYVWLYAVGTVVAAWFFVAYFAPATIRLVSWIFDMLRTANPARVGFWEAIGFGLLVLSQQLITLGVAIRDARRGRRARRRRTATNGANP